MDYNNNNSDLHYKRDKANVQDPLVSRDPLPLNIRVFVLLVFVFAYNKHYTPLGEEILPYNVSTTFLDTFCT